INHTKTGQIAPLSLNYSFNIQRATLTNRTNNYYNYTENFTYDNFDRLLTWTTPDGVESNTYEADGRIKNNSNIGNYSYNDNSSRYRKSGINLNTTGTEYYQERKLQQITYNAFKKPVLVSEEDRGSIEFHYGIYGVRNKVTEWHTDQPTENDSDIARTKFYSSDGSVEIVINGAESQSNPPPVIIQPFGGGQSPQPLQARIITYIGG